MSTTLIFVAEIDLNGYYDPFLKGNSAWNHQNQKNINLKQIYNRIEIHLAKLEEKLIALW